MDDGKVKNGEFYATQHAIFEVAKAAGATQEVLRAIAAVKPYVYGDGRDPYARLDEATLQQFGVPLPVKPKTVRFG